MGSIVFALRFALVLEHPAPAGSVTSSSPSGLKSTWCGLLGSGREEQGWEEVTGTDSSSLFSHTCPCLRKRGFISQVVNPLLFTDD